MLQQISGLTGWFGRASLRERTKPSESFGTSLGGLQPADSFGRVRQLRFGSDKQGLDASIPVLDLAEFRNAKTEAQRNAFAREFGRKFQEYGFIAIKNHGVPREEIEQHFKEFLAVMQRPEAELKQYALNKLDLGYIPEERKPDGKGGYTALDPKQMWQTRTNAALYPPDAKAFERLNLNLFRGLRNVAYDITDILARFIGGKRGKVLKDFVDADKREPGKVPTDASMMRAIRYLALKPEEMANYRQIEDSGKKLVVRTGEHRDMCLFTLLPQASDSGLQLFKKEREFPKGHPQYDEMIKDNKNWLDVFAQDGYLILNAGDMLDYMTEGLKDRQGNSKHLIATTHRVIGDEANLKRDRFSLPFFFHGNLLKPLIHLKSGKPVQRKEPVYEGQPFDSTLQMTYRRLKRAGVVPKETTYPEFVDGFKNYAKTVEKHVKDNGLDAGFHPGVPL